MYDTIRNKTNSRYYEIKTYRQHTYIFVVGKPVRHTRMVCLRLINVQRCKFAFSKTNC